MSKTFTVSFAGDTSLGDYYLKKTRWGGINNRLEENPLSFFELIKPVVQNSDYFILNLETVLAKDPQTPIDGKQYPNWDTPSRTLKVLKDLGVSAVSLANNHTMDFGPRVMLETKKQLEDEGIQTFGSGKNVNEASSPLILTLTGEKSNKNVYVLTGMRASKRYREDYGFLAQKNKPGINSINLIRMQKRIESIKSKDPQAFIIICPHWQGIDYKWASDNPKVQERCHALIDAGADYVLAHGTHMANSFEKLDNGIIAYSIGNFMFNSPGRYSRLQAPPYSLITNIQFTEDNNGKWQVEPQFYPIVTDNKLTEFKTRPVNESEIENLKESLMNKSVQEGLMYQTKQSSLGYYLKLDKKNYTKKTFGNNINNEEYLTYSNAV